MVTGGWRGALLPAAVSLGGLGALGALGCYTPSPPAGAPCTSALQCPDGQFCDRDAPARPTCLLMASPDDSGAIDVSAGGTFLFDARGADDDVDAPCAGSGGPDVRFRIALSLPEVIYFDTFGSNGDPAIAIFPGRCADAASTEPMACAGDTCGAQAQGAWLLAPGTHCIIVDHAGEPDGPGRLSVRRTGRAGDPLPGAMGTVAGNTCDDDDSNDAPCGCGSDRDHHYFFTVCPETRVTARIDTCGRADWDTVVQLRDGAEDGLGCNDDAAGTCGAATGESSLTRDVEGPGLFWAIIDGCDDCGEYTLAYDLAPAAP